MNDKVNSREYMSEKKIMIGNSLAFRRSLFAEKAWQVVSSAEVQNSTSLDFDGSKLIKEHAVTQINIF